MGRGVRPAIKPFPFPCFNTPQNYSDNSTDTNLTMNQTKPSKKYLFGNKKWQSSADHHSDILFLIKSYVVKTNTDLSKYIDSNNSLKLIEVDDTLSDSIQCLNFA